MTSNNANTEHQGQIVAHYRKMNKWSRSKLAEALHVDACTVYRMEQHSVIKDLKRRQILVGLLGIPATLMGLDQAHHSYNTAFDIAKELDDTELMAAALARRGVTFIQQNKPTETIEYLNGALNLVNGLGLPCLRGYILQALSEAHALAQQAQESWRSIELAERALERKGEVLERSNCQLNTTSVTAQKGVNAVALHDNERAIALIDKGLIRYDPTLIRGRARLTAQKAEAYYRLGFIDMCVITAEEALTLARSVGSRKTITRVRNLSTTLAQSAWRKESSVARLGAMLSIE